MAPDDFLAHFGVKGMKWGVRKERDPAGRSTESRSQRKESAKALREYMWNAIGDDPLFKEMTRAEYDALCTTGETFLAGTNLKRVADDPQAILRGKTYVSRLNEDHEFYKAALPAVGPSSKGGFLAGGGRKDYKKATYEYNMTTVKKLSSPSEKERVDAYMELLETPAIRVKGQNAPITGRAYLEKQGYKPMFKKHTTEELAFKSWHSFVQSQGDKNNPLADAYFDKLKSKGYNAVPDDFDAGTFTKKPLVLLDPESTVRVDAVRRLSTDEINQAQRQLKGKASP